MWKSIDGTSVSDSPKNITRNIDAEPHSASMLNKLLTVFSSSKQAIPIWKQEGALLQRAAHQHDQAIVSVVQPIKKTCSELLLSLATSSHTLASHAPSDDSNAMISLVSAAPAAVHLETMIFSAYRQSKARMNHVHVMSMLKSRGYSITESESESVSGQMLNAAVDMLINDDKLEKPFAKKIMRDLGYFGGLDREAISPTYQAKVIRNWIAEMIFDGSVEDFVVHSMGTVESRSDFTTSNLHHRIHNKIYERVFSANNDDGSREKDAIIKDWIWNTVILEELPMLGFSGTGSSASLALNDDMWGKMHAGLLLAKHVGIAPGVVSEEAALDLGKLMLAALEERAMPLEWGVFFRLPARCYRALNVAAKDVESKTELLAETLQTYFDFCNQVLDAHSPISTFQRLMGDFKTRPQLAQQLRERDCPEVDINTLLNFGEVTCWTTSKSPQYRLKNLYQKQVDEISHGFVAADKLKLVVAWGSLPDDEIEFIRHAHIQKMQAKFSAAHHFQSVITRMGSVLPPESLTVRLKDNVDVFSIRHSGQERLYVLERYGEQYGLKRVERRPEDFYALVHSSQPSQDKDYRFSLHGDGEPWQSKAWTLDALCDGIARQHGEKFSQALFDFGYEKTSLEKMGEVLLSFLPGYTCITQLQQGNAGPAGLACSIDVLSLFSVAGKLSSMSIKAGQSFYKGALMAIEQATGEMAARSSLKAVLGESGKAFVRHGMLPASKTIGSQELKSLGLAVARSLDPGIELFGGASLQAVRQLSELGYRVERFFPTLQRTLKKIDVSQSKALVAADRAIYTTGRLRGIARDIAIVKIEEKTNKGNALYVQIDPLSGEMFGRKYKREQDGTLKPISVSVHLRLQRLREHGMSGRGAVKAGTSYASSRAVRTIELPSGVGAPGTTFSLDVTNVEVLENLSTLGQQEFISQGGLSEIAKKNGLDLTWLESHLKGDGDLTLKGSDLLKGYHMSRWMALSNEERVLQRGSDFSASIHVFDDEWRRLVNIRGELRPSGYDLLIRLETGKPFPAPTKEQLEQWIALPMRERRRIGMIKFTLQRGISPSAFERAVKKYRPVPANTAGQVAQEAVPSSQSELAHSSDTADEVLASHSNLDTRFYQGAALFEAPPVLPAMAIQVGDASALRAASVEAMLGSDISFPHSGTSSNAVPSGAASEHASLIVRPWENLPAGSSGGSRRVSVSSENRPSDGSLSHRPSADDNA